MGWRRSPGKVRNVAHVKRMRKFEPLRRQRQEMRHRADNGDKFESSSGEDASPERVSEYEVEEDPTQQSPAEKTEDKDELFQERHVRTL